MSGSRQHSPAWPRHLAFQTRCFLEVGITNKALTCGVKQLHGGAGGRRKRDAGSSFLPGCI